MEWVLELALIVLLAATLFHALRLERALGVLKRDRAALEDLASSFNSSTRLAEQGIERLRTTADGAGRQITRQVETAAGLKDDLIFLAQRGEQLADRLEALVRAGRAVVHEPPADMPAPAYAMSARENAGRGMPAAPFVALPAAGLGDEPEPRLRSQAERDLLKALRMAR